MKFAKGGRALGRCGRCGDRYLLSELRDDGYKKGRLVCPGCFDIYPPSLKPFNADEGIILKKPAPDTDDSSGGSVVDTTGTARAGSSTTITLATTASAQTDAYINSTLTLTGGTGSGQTRTIRDYDGITKVATVAIWTVTPDATTTYSIDVLLLAGQLGFSNYFGAGT